MLQPWNVLCKRRTSYVGVGWGIIKQVMGKGTGNPDTVRSVAYGTLRSCDNVTGPGRSEGCWRVQ